MKNECERRAYSYGKIITSLATSSSLDSTYERLEVILF